MELENYEAIIFDMDGTLVDSMGGHMTAWEQVCKTFGYDFDASYMHTLGGVPTLETVVILNKKFNKTHDAGYVAEKKREAYEQLNAMPDLIQSTYQLLKTYRPIKKIGIGTGAERNNAERVLRHYGLLDTVDVLVTATDVAEGKPNAETFLTAAQLMGVAPGKCIVFEDTAIGLEAAKRAGMDCIMVENGRIQYEEVHKA